MADNNGFSEGKVPFWAHLRVIGQKCPFVLVIYGKRNGSTICDTSDAALQASWGALSDLGARLWHESFLWVFSRVRHHEARWGDQRSWRQSESIGCSKSIPGLWLCTEIYPELIGPVLRQHCIVDKRRGDLRLQGIYHNSFRVA